MNTARIRKVVTTVDRTCTRICITVLKQIMSKDFSTSPLHSNIKSILVYVSRFWLIILIRHEILGQPIHHLIHHLIQSILFNNPFFISPPFFVVVPRKPRHGMKSIPLKHITSMQGTIIVHQQDITRFHGQCGNMFFRRAFDFLTIFQCEWFHGIGVKDFGHSDFGDTTRTTIP